MAKLPVFLVMLFTILIIAFLVYTQSPKDNLVYKPGTWPEADTASAQAQHFFKLRKETGEDFKNGPCLSNHLMPGWVADIVQSPRQSMDDLPENQCSAHLEGKAKHFVELDPEGNVIRVR